MDKSSDYQQNSWYFGLWWRKHPSMQELRKASQSKTSNLQTEPYLAWRECIKKIRVIGLEGINSRPNRFPKRCLQTSVEMIVCAIGRLA